MITKNSAELSQKNRLKSSNLQGRLQESEERYRSLVAALAQMIWIVNDEGDMVGQVDAWHAYTGQPQTKRRWQDILETVHPEDLQWFEHIWHNAVSTGKPYEIVCRLRRHDGIYRHFSVRAVPARGWQGREWINIGTDIDEQATQQQLLTEAHQRMEEFIGVASHELRTPLTAIKVNVQLAMRRLKASLQLMKTTEPEVIEKVSVASELMGRTERQIGVLSQLVSNMVDISRIQTGRMESYLRQEPCDLCELIDLAISEQQKIHIGRTIHRVFSVNEPVPIFADAGRISQVVSSFLSNALKYSAAENDVDITLMLHNGWVRLEVRDHGPGLTEEEQKRVWECFYQCPRIHVLSGSGVGLGLGLYISHTIVELHQGRVGVQSAPEQGSTFWLELPLARQEE
ncbi:PAS domain-containing sensor histidine kinase [Ktedonospora formicarum]|nr:PAS domain-containing sensor histidine kinase [Ktedonospora formicarum]